MRPDLERLKNDLKNLMSRARSEGPSGKNLISTFSLTREVIRIFTRKDSIFTTDENSKEAEKILADLLFHGNRIIKALALFALLDAKNEGRTLDYKTEIRLEQFKNNPVNQEVWSEVNFALDVEKVLLQARKAHLN
jgi:hypothetical protein